MLDIKLLRDDPSAIVKNLYDRNARPFADLIEGSGWAEQAIERLTALDQHYLELLRKTEGCHRAQHENSRAMKAVGKLPKEQQGEARQKLIDEGRELRARTRDLEQETEKALSERDEAWLRVPNLTHPEAPRGTTDDDHRQLRTWGQVRDFEKEGFVPLDHVQLAESLQWVDFAAGAKVAGQKFYFLKNEAVFLDLALQQFALQVALRHGFALHITPDLARSDILLGLGFNPRGDSTQIYSIENSNLCLVGTAEITLGGMLSDEILLDSQLPLLIAGLSHCFRTEAGSHGQESRGLYRVHQFTKVELFAVTEARLEASEAMHAKLLEIEEEIFQALELPYRVLDMASSDLAGQAYRKFDIEAWMPGRCGWGEVTSTSNCTDYQARRLKVRYKTEAVEGGTASSRPKPVHMLNGTAVATSRALVAIMENHQQADGSIRIPRVLQPWVGHASVAPRS